MNLDDEVFLACRLGLAALCFYAALVGWRMGLGYTTRPDRRTRGLVGALLMFLAGLLHLMTGADESISKAGLPVPAMQWVWLALDFLVPLFFLRMAHALAARDRLEAELAAAAEHDPLTGLPNRAGFERRALAALAAASRAGKPSAAVMLDIDWFKAVNDGWGHAAGDVVLRGVAAAARGGMRREDALGRIGGEEFAMVLPGLTPAEALPLVDRLRQAITAQVPHPGAPERRLTLSAGIAGIAAQGAPALEAAFNAADQALYAAKQAGRNQACLAARAKPEGVA
ncbi:MAG: GGDEF domain-containing protein [Roseococcus sp.]|nr:GGDEF domain-containing protein [Roseococcus sp.]